MGAPESWCPGTRTLVPFQVENRFFVLISRMGFRNINFSFFLSVFMCSWHFLVLLEHCQHKCENPIKKTPKKYVGAPEFWSPGTRTLVPPIFLTAYVITSSSVLVFFLNSVLVLLICRKCVCFWRHTRVVAAMARPSISVPVSSIDGETHKLVPPQFP